MVAVLLDVKKQDSRNAKAIMLLPNSRYRTTWQAGGGGGCGGGVRVGQVRQQALMAPMTGLLMGRGRRGQTAMGPGSAQAA